MRLRKFEIKNFKGIEYASFNWEDLIVLIGENNTGKSSVLHALDLFLKGSQIKDMSLFRDNLADDDRAIEFIGHFDQLSERDQKAQAIRGRVWDDLWILKKRFWLEVDEDKPTEDGQWKELYYSYSADEVFDGWPEKDNTWDNFPLEYEEPIKQIDNPSGRPNMEAREALKELIREQKPELVKMDAPGWKPNPGGGGNWKSNANSIVPKFIFVKAVHDASDEAVSKEASTYGKIVDLIVERKLMKHPEVVKLREQIEAVLGLFRPDPDHPERQAQEIKDLQDRINEKLNDVIGGIASIETQDPDILPIILPSTTLMIRTSEQAVKTPVIHQGHGLQRTLIMALLQILLEDQMEQQKEELEAQQNADFEPRPVILGIEEPELYMHPQMQRKMRDALYRLAAQERFQVICTTHSPVFLDIADRHDRIVRVTKNAAAVKFLQASDDLLSQLGELEDNERLKLVARFNPAVNEVFFAKRVVLLEEQTAMVAFERGAELLGIFDRHPSARRDVTLIDTQGKGNIHLVQQVLNHFNIDYTVIHDEDSKNPAAFRVNDKIKQYLGSNERYLISPTDIEELLGYKPLEKDKPYQAMKIVEELHRSGSLPPEFVQAVNWVYFGDTSEPPASQ